jgi:hypothetical protein
MEPNLTKPHPTSRKLSLTCWNEFTPAPSYIIFLLIIASHSICYCLNAFQILLIFNFFNIFYFCCHINLTIDVRSPAEAKRFFPLACVSRPALGPTQLPVQCLAQVDSPELNRGRGVTLTTHPHLVPRSWMSSSYSSSPRRRLHGV